MWFAWKIALRPTDPPGPAAAEAVCHNDNLLNKVVASLSGDTQLEGVLKIWHWENWSIIHRAKVKSYCRKHLHTAFVLHLFAENIPSVCQTWQRVSLHGDWGVSTGAQKGQTAIYHCHEWVKWQFNEKKKCIYVFISVLFCNPHSLSWGSESEGILPDDPRVCCGVQGKGEKKKCLQCGDARMCPDASD